MASSLARCSMREATRRVPTDPSVSFSDDGVVQIVAGLRRRFAARDRGVRALVERAVADDQRGKACGEGDPSPVHRCDRRWASNRWPSRIRSHTSRTAPCPPAAWVMKWACDFTLGCASATAIASRATSNMGRSGVSSPILATACGPSPRCRGVRAAPPACP